MTDALKIFGKPMDSDRDWGPVVRYSVDYGIFRLGIKSNSGYVYAGLTVRPAQLDEEEFRTCIDEADAVAWLESEARRIMRECFEIAGPVHVELDANGKFSDGPFQPHTFVRFRDG